MANLRNKVELLERGVRFLQWLFNRRLVESFTDEQLQEVADHDRWPEPMPEPPSWGMSPYDRVDRKTLLWLFEKDERGILTGHDIFEIVTLPGLCKQAMRKRKLTQRR